MLAIASDHGGFRLKEEVTAYLRERGIPFEDLGTYTEESCDYPLIAEKLCRAIVAGEYERGILLCGTGIGISIAANKIKGIRAALCNDSYSARFARLHNDANVLAMGGRVIGSGVARDIVDIFLETPFEGGRHARRVAQITALEEER